MDESIKLANECRQNYDDAAKELGTQTLDIRDALYDTEKKTGKAFRDFLYKLVHIGEGRYNGHGYDVPMDKVIAQALEKRPAMIKGFLEGAEERWGKAGNSPADAVNYATFGIINPTGAGLEYWSHVADFALTVFTLGIGKGAKAAAESASLFEDVPKSVVRGTLTGNLNKLTPAERTMIDDLLDQGNNVELVPRSNIQGVQTPDFIINGVTTELKTLTGTSLNTPVTRIQDAFEQGKNVILDARHNPNITATEVETIFARVSGIYKGGLPGEIEIWTKYGIVRR